MAESPAPKLEASGSRAVAAEHITVAATGDNPQIDARTISVGAIPDPASVTAPATTHNLPRPPARVFVGRSTALDQLGHALDEDEAAAVTQAIYGLGGVGKSELALQHAHARKADYSLRWWITAGDKVQIQTGVADLAARLCREIALAGTTTDAADWAVAWLQAHDGWLLILDNVSEPADIQPLLGQLTGGHILITTRRDTGWDQTGDPIRLDVLDPGLGAEMVTTRTGQQDQASQETAELIAVELGCLPLALDQACAYITQTRITLAAYLQRLRQHPADMYDVLGGQAQQAIARTWDISLEALRAREPEAISLLHILACYAPDQIPRVILGGLADADQVATDRALALLASYCLITLTTSDVSMHRLVQAVLLSREPEVSPVFGGDRPANTALEWLDDALPADPDTNMAAWPLLRALVPHAEHLAALFTTGAGPHRLSRIQNELGGYLSSQGQYAEALELRQSALQITQAALGPDHPITAIRLSNLALSYIDLARYADALPLEERALAISEAAFGRDHPDTAISLNHLASIHNYLGRPADGLAFLERALAISEAAFGRDHPDTAVSLNNLAVTYNHLGRHTDALPLQERTLAITEAALGPDHPSTALRLANMAVTYKHLGRHTDALPLLERALAITEAALGPDHADAVWIRHNTPTPTRQPPGPMTASSGRSQGISPTDESP